MPSAGRRRRFAAWIAAVAMLLSALAPSVAHAIDAWRGTSAPLGEVCRALGAATRAVRPPSPDDGGPGVAADTACPFCCTHAASPPVLPPGSSALPAPSLSHVVPPLFLAAPRPLHAWAAPRPRGPPAPG